MNTVSYKMGKTYQNCIDNVAYTLLNIELLCDHSKTPWCNCKGKILLNSLILFHTAIIIQDWKKLNIHEESFLYLNFSNLPPLEKKI